MFHSDCGTLLGNTRYIFSHAGIPLIDPSFPLLASQAIQSTEAPSFREGLPFFYRGMNGSMFRVRQSRPTMR